MEAVFWALLAGLATIFRSRRALQLENLALSAITLFDGVICTFGEGRRAIVV
jgi:hypothetical protein